MLVVGEKAPKEKAKTGLFFTLIGYQLILYIASPLTYMVTHSVLKVPCMFNGENRI